MTWITRGCACSACCTRIRRCSRRADEIIRNFLKSGGRWLALHGTSGGKAVPVGDQRYIRKMVKGRYHETLGCFFLNHPPLRKFRVEVADRGHFITRGLPASFEVMDELYLVELQDPSACQTLLTTELATDPRPEDSVSFTTETGDWGDLTLSCGDWGWYVSVADYSRVLVSLNSADHKILSDCQYSDMETNPPNHPIGWDITNDGAGHRWLEKNGAADNVGRHLRR